MSERPAFEEAKRGSAELLILALVEDTDLHGSTLPGRLSCARRHAEVHAGGALRDALPHGSAALDQRTLGREGRPAPAAALPHYRRRPRVLASHAKTGRDLSPPSARSPASGTRDCCPFAERPARLDRPRRAARPRGRNRSVATHGRRAGGTSRGPVPRGHRARQRRAARTPRGHQALETSGLLPLRREPRQDARASHAHLANHVASTPVQEPRP